MDAAAHSSCISVVSKEENSDRKILRQRREFSWAKPADVASNNDGALVGSGIAAPLMLNRRAGRMDRLYEWVLDLYMDNPGPALERRVGHVGTVSTAPRDQAPNTTGKNAFVNGTCATGLGLTGYSPGNGFTFDETSRVQREAKTFVNPNVLSLMTAQDQLWSILMLERRVPNSPIVWICGGKRQVTPSQLAAIVQALS